MKLLTKAHLAQKITFVLVIVILFNFLVPIRSQAAGAGEIGGDLLKELIKLFVSLGDVVNGIMNRFMLGTSKMYGSAILSVNSPELDANLGDSTSSLYYGHLDKTSDGTTVVTPPSEENGDVIMTFPEGFLFEAWGSVGGDSIQIPNILYCPENIFANKIAALDVNFLNPNTYSAVESSAETSSLGTNAEDAAVSFSERQGNNGGPTLRAIIATWYKGFRNLAIVGLLIVLVYLGIRIMISSTSTDKAKYKENLQDWLVAFCLIFFIHYIMSGIIMLSEAFTTLVDKSVDSTIYVDASKAEEHDSWFNGGNDPMTKVKFKTTITGYIRFMVQVDETGDSIAYSIMFFALTIYTLMFTVTYIKRFLYVAFFTMMAPLVALTYPLDKIRDGKAQAFNTWLKEYTMNVIIQPVHLLLFSVFIGSAMNLAANNPIYAIVAMGFLLPAEKIIKKMFGLEATTTGSGLGEIAAGALAMKGMSSLIGTFTGKDKKGNNANPKPADKIRKRGIDPDVSESRDYFGNVVRATLGGATVATGVAAQAGNPNAQRQQGQNLQLGAQNAQQQGQQQLGQNPQQGNPNRQQQPGQNQQQGNPTAQQTMQNPQQGNPFAQQIMQNPQNPQMEANMNPITGARTADSQILRDMDRYQTRTASGILLENPDIRSQQQAQTPPPPPPPPIGGSQVNPDEGQFVGPDDIMQSYHDRGYYGDANQGYWNPSANEMQSDYDPLRDAAFNPYKNDILDLYESEGGRQNENGEYWNPTAREFQADYDPLRDRAYYQQVQRPSEQEPYEGFVEIPPRQTFAQRAKGAYKTATHNARAGTRAIVGKKARTIQRAVTEPFQRGNRLATAGKAARFTAKVAGAAIGGAALGAVGLGAGITTGDFSKASSMMAAGATLGANAGARGTERLANSTGNMIQNDIETYRHATRTPQEYVKEEQEKVDRDWKRDPKNYEYLRNHGFGDKEAKQFLNSNRLDRYRRETGIDDVKTLHRTMKLVDSNHYSDAYGIQIARMVDNSSAEFKESERNNVRKNMEEQHGLSRDMAKRVISDMAKIKDLEPIE